MPMTLHSVKEGTCTPEEQNDLEITQLKFILASKDEMIWYSQTIVGTCLYYKTSSLLISQPNRASVLNNPAVFCLYTGYERVLVFQERLIYPEKKKKAQNNIYFSKWEAIKKQFSKVFTHILLCTILAFKINMIHF